MAADVWAFAHDDDYRDIPFMSVGHPDDRPLTSAACPTALHYAVWLEDVGLVKEMLQDKYKACRRHTHLSGTTQGILMVPLVPDPSGPARPLLKQPVHTLPAVRGNYTALHMAAYMNNVEGLKLILEHLKRMGLREMYVNQRAGRLRKTPLMYAAGVVSGDHKKNNSCVPLLIEHKADPSLTDTKQRTALQHAIESRQMVKDKQFGGDVLRRNAQNTVDLLSETPRKAARSRKRLDTKKTPPETRFSTISAE